jgi:hypoxanthine phosphoribosyltransferase
MTSAALLATPARPAFAHASEAELARILDFYQVRWRYEPDTFPIGWSMTGDVVESFSPDFYLPDLDLYVELTTLKQKLVRKKNRKLRRLRELYPDVRIKLFYARDFRMLLLKFGRLALLDDLSGTTGQATPPRPADRIVTEAGAAAGLGGPSLDASLGVGDDQDDLDDEGGDAAGSGLGAALTVTPLRAAAAPQAPSTTRGRRRGRRRRRDGRDAGVVASLPDMPGIAVIAGITGPDAVGEPA